MASLAVYQPDARAAARMSAALGGAHHCVVHSTWADLHRALEEETVEGCIVDADHPSRTDARSEIALLRRNHPNLAIVAFADLEGEMDYFDFGELGVERVLSAQGYGDVHVRSAVEEAMSVSRAARVGRALDGRIGTLGVRAVRWAMEHATFADVDVDEFALAMGHTARSLASTLASEGLPNPSRLLVWGRLLIAGGILGRDERTVEETAYLLHYSSASALSRAMKKHTGCTPSEVAKRGGLACVHGALFGRLGGNERALRALRSLAGLFLVGAVASCAGAPAGSPTTLRAAVDSVLDSPPVDQTHFGVLAVHTGTGEVLYSRNAHRKFIPASNQKVLVTATAISVLGPDYRYRTEVRAVGRRNGSTLEGDLLALPSGDPSWSDRYWEGGGEGVLAAMADSIRAKGVRRVTGDLVIDATAWDSTTVGPTWEVEDLRYRYAATGGVFGVDEGEVEIVVTAGPDVGLPATIGWRPFGDADFVSAQVTTAPPDSSRRVRPDYHPESRRLTLHGRVPLGSVDTVSYAQRDPVVQAAAALQRAVASAGIVVDGRIRVRWPSEFEATDGCRAGSNPMCGRGESMFVFRSPEMADLIAGVLEPSQNWMTEQLVRTLGAERGEEGSWEEGLDVMRSFLTEEVGVDSMDVAPRDGSGLSFYNLVTPRAMIRILDYMRRGPNAEAFRRAMAEPAEEESTLENRLAGLEGRVFAKTGTISNVNSLSGYLVGSDGQDVMFSILSNGSGLPARRVRAAIDDVVRVLAR